MDNIEINNPILHVLVIGFHHKKGCQVEYSYPPLLEDQPSESNECPPGWKYLPTLALPDGSHNYTHDTVYFHLPSLKDPNRTVFGISCYRQISVEKIKNRTSDLTRDTVQKAVCVLSVIPLYGHIEIKMSLITQAYFEEGDFTKVSLLKDTYENLNLCLNNLEDVTSSPKFFVGLSARDFVMKFRHKAVLLFKLLLLEKKIIFYCSPVNVLCSTILSLLSLHPGMLEKGLYQSACFRPSRPMSPVPNFRNDSQYDGEITGNESQEKKNQEKSKRSNTAKVALNNTTFGCNYNVSFNRVNIVEAAEEISEENVPYIINALEDEDKIQSTDNDSLMMGNIEYDIIGDVTIQTNLSLISQLDLTECGTPLVIFTEGYLCLPYLSLPYMDVLLDRNTRGYVIGATNVLFKQKKNLADILIEVDTAKIETDDLQLKRLLHLSMEDLRFADDLVKHVCEEKQNLTDGVMWKGGDEWIRMQFKIYLFSLLRTSMFPDGYRELDYFNSAFVSAWRDTNNYKAWICDYSDTIKNINPCHPFPGQLSVADVKLKLSHTLQCSDSGRKLNQAMVNTSNVVATTGRAVGGALSQARETVSRWFTNLTNVSTSKTAIDSLDTDSLNRTESLQKVM